MNTPAPTAPPIIGLVITLNEIVHIERCLTSLSGLCDRVLVVDSGSTDGTVALSERLGAQVIYHPFVTHAEQVNAGIDYLGAQDGAWMLRIDADEYLDRRQHDAIRKATATAPNEVAGFELLRHLIFFGRRLHWGGLEPNPQLRLWRAGRGRSEQRWMDEHINVNGEVVSTRIDLFDENLNSISWWTDKHNRYASREAVQILLADNTPVPSGRLGRTATIKRFIKNNIYNRIPLGLRAFMYFILRYFLLLGFLDGIPGLFFHFLQGFWYRLLVDAKVLETRRTIAGGVPKHQAIAVRLGIDVRHQCDH